MPDVTESDQRTPAEAALDPATLDPRKTLFQLLATDKSSLHRLTSQPR